MKHHHRHRDALLILVVFVLGFGTGIVTLFLHTASQEYVTTVIAIDTAEAAVPIAIATTVTAAKHDDDDDGINTVQVDLDPFPLPPCTPNRTSAVYIFYGHPLTDHYYGHTLFKSIQSLLRSNFPGQVRVIIDEQINATLLDLYTATKGGKQQKWLPKKFRQLLSRIHFDVVPLPSITKTELIPHSNKIRALQAKAFVGGSTSDVQECTVSFDTDTYIHPQAPWTRLLSTLQYHDVAVTKDCDVRIDNVPDYLQTWMPNTGVLAMRNTPRTQLVLRDWLARYRPCNADDVTTCMPGTDQYPFLQLLVHHAVRFYRLETAWNCRIPANQPDRINEFPLYAISVLSTSPRAPDLTTTNNGNNDTTVMIPTCGGIEACHVLHGHFLTYFK